MGRYIDDLTCLDEKLIVGVDGGQHSGRQLRDSERDGGLGSQGHRVLRFWNNHVLNDVEAVKKAVSGNTGGTLTLTLSQTLGEGTSLAWH